MKRGGRVDSEFISKISDKIAKKINTAVSQSETQYIKKKIVVKTSEYDEELKKPIEEKTIEEETVIPVKGGVDMGKLKEACNLLKDLTMITGQANKDEGGCGGVIVLADINDDKDEKEYNLEASKKTS